MPTVDLFSGFARTALFSILARNHHTDVPFFCTCGWCLKMQQQIRIALEMFAKKVPLNGLGSLLCI
jgi:hypothetical protein